MILLSIIKITSLIDQMKQDPKDLCKVCDHYFGEPRQESSSHMVYKTPWYADPRVNIQNDKGNAKAYQVRQVLKALEKLGVK